MTIVFFDASALVKLYVPEPGPDVVSSVDVPAMISELTRVELPSALWRKHRLGQLSAQDASDLSTDFEADYYGEGGQARFAVMRISDITVSMAARLAPHREALTRRDVIVGPQAGLELLPRDQAFDKLLQSRYLVEKLSREWTWTS